MAQGFQPSYVSHVSTRRAAARFSPAGGAFLDLRRDPVLQGLSVVSHMRDGNYRINRLISLSSIVLPGAVTDPESQRKDHVVIAGDEIPAFYHSLYALVRPALDSGKAIKGDDRAPHVKQVRQMLRDFARKIRTNPEEYLVYVVNSLALRTD